MTRLRSPGVSFQSVSRFFNQNQSQKRETERDDPPGEPRHVIPVRFRVFQALFGKKTPKRTGKTRLGVSSPKLKFSNFGPPSAGPKLEFSNFVLQGEGVCKKLTRPFPKLKFSLFQAESAFYRLKGAVIKLTRPVKRLTRPVPSLNSALYRPPQPDSAFLKLRARRPKIVAYHRNHR